MGVIPKRKPVRLTAWDYSSQGAYFVTICTRGKEMLLGKIVGGGVYDAPQMQLSARGENVENSLRQMREYGAVTVEKAVIMPNHIHLLLAVRACANGSS